MLRRIVVLAAGLLAAVLMLFAGWAARPAAAQDGWTDYEINLRASPNGDVIAVLPVNTPLIFEARSADSAWLLGHTPDSAYRGWVASGYLVYAEGFAAVRLPVSEEVVAAGSVPPPAPPAESAPPVEIAAPTATPLAPGIQPDGTLEFRTLIFESDHAEYYRMTYWSDGLRVNGYMGWPKGPGPYPVVVFNRGGFWDNGALKGTEIVAFVETGYVAVASQYRGNGGSEGLETFGHGDVIDTINLITLAQGLPQADPWNIGMMGYSRGGMVAYMVIKAEAESGRNRIRAAVTVAGVADLFMWVEDNPDILEILTVLVGPLEQTELYAVRSATYWPEWINVPLLLLHGGADLDGAV